MTNTTTAKQTRIPAPLYAAAGAGDLAYQQLRKLPTVVGELSGRAVAGGLDLREKAIASLRTAEVTAAQLRDRAEVTAGNLKGADLEVLRDQALKSTVSFAQLAQERAVAVYTSLVAHGERVIGTGIVKSADTVNADIEATEAADAPKPVTATPADVVKDAPAKPAKATTRAKKAAGGSAAK
jgi:hypothetical protein